MQPIKQPSRPGGIYEHARRSAEYARMHGAAGAGGYLTTKGFIPNPRKKAKNASKSEVRQFRVAQVHKDHLICNSYKLNADGTETIGTEDVQIAKPFEFRATPWDGETVDGYTYTYNQNGNNGDDQKNPWNERTVTVESIPLTTCHPEITGTGISILEKIWPEYQENRSIIYAQKVKEQPVVRHESILLSSGPPEIYSEDVTCEYVDLNVDGRSWQMPYRKVAICIENTDGTFAKKFVLIRTSCPFV